MLPIPYNTPCPLSGRNRGMPGGSLESILEALQGEAAILPTYNTPCPGGKEACLEVFGGHLGCVARGGGLNDGARLSLSQLEQLLLLALLVLGQLPLCLGHSALQLALLLLLLSQKRPAHVRHSTSVFGACMTAAGMALRLHAWKPCLRNHRSQSRASMQPTKLPDSQPCLVKRFR